MSGSNFHIRLNGSDNQGIRLNELETMRIRMISPASGSFSGKISIDTTAGWQQKLTYIPGKGEIVIFSDRNTVDNIDYPGIKIGDGLAYVVDLPFFGDDESARILGIISTHVNDTSVHVSPEDRAFWNAKLNYEAVGETLVFTRN